MGEIFKKISSSTRIINVFYIVFFIDISSYCPHNILILFSYCPPEHVSYWLFQVCLLWGTSELYSLSECSIYGVVSRVLLMPICFFSNYLVLYLSFLFFVSLSLLLSLSPIPVCLHDGFNLNFIHLISLSGDKY